MLEMGYGADDPETAVTELLGLVRALELEVNAMEDAVVLMTGREVKSPVVDVIADGVKLRLVKSGEAVGPTIGKVLLDTENGGVGSGVDAPVPGGPVDVSTLLGPVPVGPGVALEFDVE